MDLNNKNQTGFTLVELMIVVAIMAILTAIAIPSYQSYIIKTDRSDMMAELQNIASDIEAKKMAKGGRYKDIKVADLSSLQGDYPRGGSGAALYTVVITPFTTGASAHLEKDWIITATPKVLSRMEDDGNLTYNNQSIKCRIIGTDKKCGSDEQWKN